MYTLLIEDLARARERAQFREAGERRLAAQVAARECGAGRVTVGLLRRAAGRALIAMGSRVAGEARGGAR